ncbi:uncharacterized protein [Solanum lycopersicum]|uniref:uncharacterized protein n=1 Tax=Solanum lycopersicum TaxID=4081 RepID=UPI003748675C
MVLRGVAKEAIIDEEGVLRIKGREKLLVAQDRQKEYADRNVRDMDFMEGEQVLLKVSPMKGVMRFGKRGKLSPRTLRSAPGISCVSAKKYHGDGNYIIRWDSVLLDENLSYEEEPVAILDREGLKFRSRKIASIKV